jgi:membrane-associated phospholipid phosphatase
MPRSFRRRRRSSNPIAPLLFGATAVVAGAGFALLARASARRDTAEVDEELHQKTAPSPGHPVRKGARMLGPVGKWYTYIPAALGMAGYLVTPPEPSWLGGGRRRSARRQRGAGAIVASSLASFALSRAFDRWLPQPPAPPGHPPEKPVFPSGHAFGPTAVGLAGSYILGREGLASRSATLPAAVAVPLVAAATRIIDEKHWGSDVLGGVVGGVAVAAVVLAAYELADR